GDEIRYSYVRLRPVPHSHGPHAVPAQTRLAAGVLASRLAARSAARPPALRGPSPFPKNPGVPGRDPGQSHASSLALRLAGHLPVHAGSWGRLGRDPKAPPSPRPAILEATRGARPSSCLLPCHTRGTSSFGSSEGTRGQRNDGTSRGAA